MIRLLGFVLLLHGYIAWRLLPDLAFGLPAALAVAAWLALSAGLITLGVLARLQRQSLSQALAWLSWIALGSFSSLFVLTLLRDAGLLLVYAVDLMAPLGSLVREIRTASATAVPLIAAAFTLLGFVNARRRAAVRSVDVAIEGLPAGLHGFMIAQISDVHVGTTIRRPYVEAIVDAVNAIGADLIAVTGDLVDGSVAQLSGQTAPLARLSARHGAYFVTGNHEYYSGARAWVAEIERLGMRALMNEHVVLVHAGERMIVAGVTDWSAHHFEPGQRSDPAAAMANAPAAAFRLLLAHQPRSAFAAEPAGFDLQLSGHTHGGQFWPWNYFVRLQQPFTAGLRRLGRLWVYTSRGTGYWGPPKRLWAPSEITRLRLVPA
jgi:predicted MPP superfamily phosphohydrolase